MAPGTPRRILAFGAHPDDIEIYALGLLLQLKARGWELCAVVATDGQAGLPDGAAPGVRREEAQTAAARAGMQLSMLGLDDGRLHDGPAEIDAARRVIANFNPDLIVAPSPADYHPDHRALSRIAEAACPVRTALIHSDTMMGVGFDPEFAVDIGAVFDEKQACLAAHRSQRPEMFFERLRVWSAFRALQTATPGVDHAEAFRVSRSFGRASVHALLTGVML